MRVRQGAAQLPDRKATPSHPQDAQARRSALDARPLGQSLGRARVSWKASVVDDLSCGALCDELRTSPPPCRGSRGSGEAVSEPSAGATDRGCTLDGQRLLRLRIERHARCGLWCWLSCVPRQSPSECAARVSPRAPIRTQFGGWPLMRQIDQHPAHPAASPTGMATGSAAAVLGCARLAGSPAGTTADERSMAGRSQRSLNRIPCRETHGYTLRQILCGERSAIYPTRAPGACSASAARPASSAGGQAPPPRPACAPRHGAPLRSHAAARAAGRARAAAAAAAAHARARAHRGRDVGARRGRRLLRRRRRHVL
jgi:hypothetical protein